MTEKLVVETCTKRASDGETGNGSSNNALDEWYANRAYSIDKFLSSLELAASFSKLDLQGPNVLVLRRVQDGMLLVPCKNRWPRAARDERKGTRKTRQLLRFGRGYQGQDGQAVSVRSKQLTVTILFTRRNKLHRHWMAVCSNRTADLRELPFPLPLKDIA